MQYKSRASKGEQQMTQRLLTRFGNLLSRHCQPFDVLETSLPFLETRVWESPSRPVSSPLNCRYGLTIEILHAFSIKKLYAYKYSY